jgi:type II secretory pathway pseudopilin PulG
MTSSPQGRTNSEAGYILLAVLFLVALILLSLAVAAPRVAKSIQRDKELELIHRGEQYKRAIKLYYRKFGSYPASIDQLENTNNIRFLRKRYTDPMTGKDDWKIIHFGQAHVQTLGLFGQPIATAGGGPGGVAGGIGAGGIGAGGIGTGGIGTGGIGTGGIGAATGGLGSAGTPLTGSGSITAPTTGGTDGSGTSGTDGSGSTGGSTSGSGTGGLGTGGLGTGGMGTGGLGTTGTGGLSAGGLGTGATGNTNPTFGGGPIVGLAIPSTKASIKEYKQQKHYNEWEFVYDPVADQMQAGTAFGGTGQNLNGPGTTNGTSGTFGSGFGNTTGAGGATTPTGGTGSGAGSPTPQQ